MLAAVVILGAGLTTGGIMTASATTECPREACNAGKCDWFGNMTTCKVVGGECEDGPCGGPPSDPGEN